MLWLVLDVVIVISQPQSLVAPCHPDPDVSGFKGFHGCLCSPLRSLLLSGPGATRGTEGLRLDDRGGRADRRVSRG